MINSWKSLGNIKHALSEEDGNVLVYVLIAVVLFGALSFAMSRQTNTSATAELDVAKLEFHASDVIGYSMQAKSVIEQMMITGSSIDDYSFAKPSDTSFNIHPHTHKVYHPHGGGLNDKTLPDAITVEEEPEEPGWYMTSSIDVEWSDSNATDVVLTAYQINKPLCALLNKKITGSTDIPALPGQLEDYFLSTGGSNDLTAAVCPACDGYSTLCVSNSNEDSFGFYSVLIAR